MNRGKRNKILFPKLNKSSVFPLKDLIKLRGMDLEKEYLLVRNKKSLQPRHMRDLIVYAYLQLQNEEMRKKLEDINKKGIFKKLFSKEKDNATKP